jgi:hypothetical protein
MTADPPESSVAEGVCSLEVRWFFPGQFETAVAEWFGRFPAETQAREDTYLLDPQLRGLSVKIRGGVALDVKVYRGSPGILYLPGRARGRMEAWQKWSFPIAPFGQDSADLADWRPVRKTRRISRFSLASRPVSAQAPGLGQKPQCAVELTEVRTPGRDWWTLGFEATGGPDDLLRRVLQGTAALVFAQALPGSVEPGPDESRSYMEWLCQWPGAERVTPTPEGRPSAEPIRAAVLLAALSSPAVPALARRVQPVRRTDQDAAAQKIQLCTRSASKDLGRSDDFRG